MASLEWRTPGNKGSLRHFVPGGLGAVAAAGLACRRAPVAGLGAVAVGFGFTCCAPAGFTPVPVFCGGFLYVEAGLHPDAGFQCVSTQRHVMKNMNATRRFFSIFRIQNRRAQTAPATVPPGASRDGGRPACRSALPTARARS